jgi:hypothetical protein
MSAELRGFGSYFVLQPGACIGDYGFVEDERLVLDTLSRGATLEDLATRHREIDSRRLHAMVYALVCCRDVAGVDRGRCVTSDFGALANGTRHDARPPLVDRRIAADAALQRAHRALGSDQPEVAIAELHRAIELDPQTVDYRALLAWARFCAAKNKRAVANEVKNTLGKIMRVSHRPELARFYLGRVERILGNDREALVHFQEVLAVQPRHAEASVEVRFILQRLPALRAAR